MTEDPYLIKVKKFFRGKSLWKRYEMKGKQSMWIHRETRKNLFYLYKYVYEKQKKEGKTAFINIDNIAKALKKDPESIRPNLYILCYLKNNLLKWSAYRSFKKGRKKPKIIQRFRAIITEL